MELMSSSNNSSISGKTSSGDFITLRDAAIEYLTDLQDGTDPLFTTSLAGMDEALGGGIAKGEMAVVAARPSMGKTLLGLQWLQHVAAEGTTCAILSEEMPYKMLAKRHIQGCTRLQEHEWREHFQQVYADVTEHWSSGVRDVIIPIAKCRSFDRACQKIENMVERHGVEFVVLDYMQLLRGNGKSRYEEMTNGCMALKSCAVACDVALVALCQMNRQIDSRRSNKDEDGRPRFSDLRDTGQIEQDADVIAFLDWPHMRDSVQPESDYRIYVAKNRNRGIRKRTVKCRIEPSRQLIHDVIEHQFT